MFDLIAKALAAIYNVVPNYALAIMILTLAIMIVLTPLTLKGTRSMLAMQQLQPEMKKLQAKHKDDRQKLNEEMMAFYKENKINPMSGCLPLILQMPVFFVLYRVLYGLTSHAYLGTDMGGLAGRVLGGNAGATLPSFGSFAPKYLDKSSKLYQSLSGSNQMKSFGIDLSENATKALSKGFGRAIPFLVLIILVTATSYIQQRQVTARNVQQDSNPQQQMLLKIMPLFMGFISLTLPGGVVVYFLVSNLYRVGQQAFITRTMYAGGAPGSIIPASASASVGAVNGGAPKIPDDAPPRKGLLASLGFDREATPGLSGKVSSTNGGGQGKGGATTTLKKAPAAAAKTGANRSSTKGGAKAGGSIKATGAGSGGKKPSRAAVAGGNGAAKRASAPARSSPPPPVNRSRNKKKRK